MTLLFALLLAAAEPGDALAPHATVPLAEWERLRKLEERPSLTVVDLLRVEGSFARRDLAVTLAGRTAGSWPSAEILTASGARLHSCDGDAVVSRSDSGAFAVTPLAARFHVRCRVSLDGSDRLEGTTTSAVLEVTAAVRDGELVASDAGAGRSFSVVRAIAGAREDLPPSVAGHYQLTLLPDETRFAYRLEVRNPSRGHRRFAVTLRETEHVESVGAPVAWDVDGRTYRFDLPPGDMTLALSGRLTAASFTPPVDASVQYLLVESHPLVRADVRTGAKRVGVAETGLDPGYRGAQAFLLDGGSEVSWTATRLEALKTAGIALDALEQVFFLAADGTARSETTFALDNQGAPALALPTPGEPTFASVGGEPVFLTRDAQGQLLLPLGQGAQPVVVQDARRFASHLGFAFARLELPRAGVPASRATIEVRYPAEWIPLYEELAPSSRLHLPGAWDLAVLALLLVAAERLLALAAVPAGRRRLLAAALTATAALSTPVRVLALLAAAALLVALVAAAVVRRLGGRQRAGALAALALGVVLVLAAAAGANVVGRAPRDERVGGLGSAPMNYVDKLGARQEAPPVAFSKGPPGASARPGYEGLPAHISLPPGVRRTSFERELLATDAPRPVFAVLVAARVVAALEVALGVVLLALAFLFRRDLAAGARAFRARLLAG